MWATGLVVCVTGFNAKFKQEAKAAVVAAGGTCVSQDCMCNTTELSSTFHVYI